MALCLGISLITKPAPPLYKDRIYRAWTSNLINRDFILWGPGIKNIVFPPRFPPRSQKDELPLISMHSSLFRADYSSQSQEHATATLQLQKLWKTSFKSIQTLPLAPNNKNWMKKGWKPTVFCSVSFTFFTTGWKLKKILLRKQYFPSFRLQIMRLSSPILPFSTNSHHQLCRYSKILCIFPSRM